MAARNAPVAGPRPGLEEAGVLPAVDREGGAGNETRGIAGEKDDRHREFLRPAISPEWNLLHAPCSDFLDVDTEPLRLVAAFVADPIGVDESGEDRVHPDRWRRLLRQSL